MHRIQALFVSSLLLILVYASPAQASGDFECSPSWLLMHGELSDCTNMAMLSPGNDTRVNLLLLLADRDGQGAAEAASLPQSPMFDWPTLGAYYAPRPKSDDGDSFAQGEGSRCRSNDSGTTGFEAAVQADGKLADDERKALIAARHTLRPDCVGAAKALPAIAAATIRSASGRAFLAYLNGAAAFYGGDYNTAAAQFASLRKAGSPWLRETAAYMLGRVEVNRAQVGLFDEYGYRGHDKVADKAVIAHAETMLQAYLKAYPKGLYAASARGLMRRVYWLGGQTDKLADQYASLLAQPPAARGLDDVALAEEMDSKLLPAFDAGETSDPILLAVIDLRQMRVADNEADSTCCHPMSRAELESQRARFAPAPGLFDTLLAIHALYVERRPDAVLPLIPEAQRQARFTTLDFTRQMLRGIALEQRKDGAARGFWLDMIPGAAQPFQRPILELALALHDERVGAIDKVFAADSPVRTAEIREILLTNVADAKLLRRQASARTSPQRERDLALFTLLYKEATRGPHADFVKDLALVPADAPSDPLYGSMASADRLPLGIFTQVKTLGDYGCPPLRETQMRLAANARDAKAMLCLADFLRVNSFDGFGLDYHPSGEQLGATPSLFPGQPYSRLEVYKAIIADPKATAPDKAYALYRAVNCYAPSRINACGGTDVPPAGRKTWFRQLKQDYPRSHWAEALQYYW